MFRERDGYKHIDIAIPEAKIILRLTECIIIIMLNKHWVT